MTPFPIPADEAERLAVLRDLEILDTPPEERFDRITRLAHRLFDATGVFLTLVDSERVWAKSKQGLDLTSIPRDVAFCAHTILSCEPLVVADTLEDPRFKDNPMVTGEARIRFYAGCPVRNPGGAHVGVLCVVDRRPRSFGPEEIRMLKDLAELAACQLYCKELSLAVSEEREMRGRLRQVTENIRHVLWLNDLSSSSRRMLYVSPAYEQVWGRPREDLYGNPKAWMESIHPEDRERVLKAYAESSKTGRFRQEYRILRPDGSLRYILDQGFPICDALGKAGRMAGIAEDVTEQKLVELKLQEMHSRLVQAQKLNALGRLAGGIAHDFNNLMMAVKGYSQLLLPTFSAKDERKADVKQIQEVAERATRLTRQLLAFGRRQVLHPTVMNLNPGISHICRLIRNLIPANIRIKRKLDKRLALVRVDPAQFEQVMMNLLINGKEAMPKGGTITIETGNEVLEEAKAKGLGLSPGSYVRLEVADEGSGMDQETLSHLFEPFFTTKKGSKSAGLGLSTVYGIVEQSGGYIGASSQQGKGARFTVYFPRVEGETEKPAPRRVFGQYPRGKETILLAEDEEAVRALVGRVLRRCGYCVLEAGDGESALKAGRRFGETIHLLLTDVVMPKMGGIELARRFSRIHPESKVVYMSGYAEEAVLRGKLEPKSVFIEKPAAPMDLARLVREVLGEAKKSP